MALLLLVLLLLYSMAQSCTTVGGPQAGQACQFPFTFTGVVRTGCVTEQDPQGRRWCSTLTDSSGVHVGGGGHWGLCAPDCPRDRQATSSSSSSTSSSSSSSSSSSFSISSPCTSESTCTNPASCVGADLTNLDKAGCTLPDEGFGLCCEPSVALLTALPSPSRPPARDPSLPAIPLAEVEQILREVSRSFVSGVAEVLKVGVRGLVGALGGGDNSLPSDLGGGDNSLPSALGGGDKSLPFAPASCSASALHQRLNSPRASVLQLDSTAQTLLEVTRRLKQQWNLTDIQAGTGLRSQFSALSSLSLSKACPWTPAPSCSASKFRSLDGRCNSRVEANHGRVGTPYQRILLPQYARSSLDLPRKRTGDARELPPARTISNMMGESGGRRDSENSLLLMQMGQFIDHDITHTPNYADQKCCTKTGRFPRAFDAEKCFPLRLPKNDPFWKGSKTCMEFSRSLASPGLACELQHREQLNQVTHWLDGSNIYGSTSEEAAVLRAAGGRLAVSGLDQLPSCREAGAGDREACRACKGRLGDCYYAGDQRVNEQPNLIVVHTLFMREHNRIVDKLSLLNTGWEGERLYQEARRINVAQYQHIVYREWLPIILGNNYMKLYGLFPLTEGFSSDYSDNFDPRINNEFAAAAFRFGHSLVPATFLSMAEDSSRRPRKISLKEVFFRPKEMKAPGELDGLMRGLTREGAMGWDSLFVADLRNHLFEPVRGQGGLDLVAVNIQRGRDHGLPGYNAYREICGLGKAEQWSDLRKNMEPADVSSLERVYNSLDDVDLFVGGSLEQPHQDSLVGPVFKCIVGDQFARLKKGDRYFYSLGLDSLVRMTGPQLQQVRLSSMARIICDNSQVRQVQPFAFRLPNTRANSMRPCSDLSALPAPDLSHFRS